ncbi:tectonic-2-like isoform X2 [Mercenaria mercenaria]|uniref:tectonic-2-like isoform X2 n=1 Tax=Mercenaria mercenaria TaxID=6596 RepID=UPI001E1D99ED|nr:tectonic-2-like isoform X2 [Mercenaria mercenaria]
MTLHRLSLFSFLLAFTPILSQNTAQTVVANAAFEDVAPCPCDLTQGSCDINCCCDGSCSSDEKKTFDGCIPFLPGGQDAETQQYKCASDHHHKADWFPFLCVVFEYNAFLGYYYEWQYKLAENVQAILRRLFTRTFYWYREEEARILSDSTDNVYRYGVSVKTSKGILTLPQPTLNGQCMYTAPVRYLKDLEHSCSYTISDSLCSPSSVLSALSYIQSSNNNSILEEESSVVIASTNVVYKCATNLQSYLKSTQTISDIIDNTQVYKFNYNLPTDPNCVDECGSLNDKCIDLNNLTNPDPITPPTTLTDCPSQTPAAPTLANGICSDAVIDVEYTIKWTGNKVARLDAVVILADFPIQNAAGTNNVLSQKYKTTFVHNVTSVGNGSTDNFNNITDSPYERSGRVGYDAGNPIFTGSEVKNTTLSPPEFMYVNTNTTRQMAVFDTIADGLCLNAGRRSIKFREDITTQCKLMLNHAEFSDCLGLRKLIINRLNNLMPSDLIGRRGYNDQANRGYWLPVLRDDLTPQCILSEYFPLGLSPVDNRTGICYNITSGIHLEIFYGVTGKSNSFPIYEILGSKVSYSNTTWQVRCSGPAGGVCQGTNSQPFYLTSSVRFIEIPPQTPEPVSRYYETPREEDKQLCPGDICWDNLFYPFTRRYNSDSREYVFGMVSLSIIFFVGYLLVSRPFW